MAFQFLAVKASSSRDPGGLRLRTALEAHLALERAGRSRLRRVHAVAVLSVPVAVALAWPGWPSEAGRRFVLVAWLLSALAAAAAAVSEWWCWRKLRSVAENIREDLPSRP